MSRDDSISVPYDAWVLIADGEKALFLKNLTDAQDPHLEVVRKEEQENPKDIDQSANRKSHRIGTIGLVDSHTNVGPLTNRPSRYSDMSRRLSGGNRLQTGLARRCARSGCILGASGARGRRGTA